MLVRRADAPAVHRGGGKGEKGGTGGVTPSGEGSEDEEEEDEDEDGELARSRSFVLFPESLIALRVCRATCSELGW